MHLTQTREQLRSHWRLFAVCLVPYVFGLIVLLLPQIFQSASKNTDVVMLSSELSVTKAGPWQHFDLSSLLLSGDSGWLKIGFDVPESMISPNRPLGLYLSGTFSASAIWNGQSVGGKGTPGGTRLFEQPGAIDEVIFLPGEIIQPGVNTLLMEVSSFYRPAEITTIIHGQKTISGLRVGPYSSDPRRPIGYYAAPFVLSGMLVVSFFVLLFRSTGMRSIGLLLAGSLAVAAIAEVSRSFVNYGYAYHGLRLWTITLLALFFSQLLLVLVMRFQHHQYSWSLTGLFLCLVLVMGYSFSDSFLLSPPLVISLAALSGLGCLAYSRFQKHTISWALVFALVVIPLVMLMDMDGFMDRGLYAACLPLITFLAGGRDSSEQQIREQEIVRQEGQASSYAGLSSDRLLVKTGGKEKIIPFSEVRLIQGAGNYAEINLMGNESLLDDRSLNQLEAEMPDSFFRVHRSYIVNLEHVVSVQSLGAGKYRLELKDGQQFPVSRNKISSLRERI